MIAPLQADHWPAVRRIYAAGIETGHATFESEPPAWEQFDAGKLTEHRWVAVDANDGAILGWAAAAPVSARPVYAGVVEHSVYVDPAARGNGIGYQLLTHLARAAEAAGIWTLQSPIFPENLASLRLHQAAGFHTVGIRRRIGKMPCGPFAGQWRDVVFVERRSTVAGIN